MRAVGRAPERAAELDAAQWRERLAHLVRVHTAGEMSAALAHEINQPLMAIENYALAARRRMAEDSPTTRGSRTAGQGDRADDARRRRGDAHSRHGAAARARPEGDRRRARGQGMRRHGQDGLRAARHPVELKPAGPLPVIVADEIQLQQVVLNLLRNAIEAMELPQPGAPREITIEVGLDGADAVSVRSPTAARASPKTIWSGSSTPSIRPSPPAWASAWRSAAS